MSFYEKSTISIIEAKYASLTQVERNIADFFLNNKEKNIDFSAKSICKKVFVSEASLSRFAQKCGFRGYRDFIYKYEENLDSAKKNLAIATKSVFESYQELLNKTYSLMNDAQLKHLIDALYTKKRVIVCGQGSSALAANEMENRFMRIGLDIDSLEHADRIYMQAPFLDSKYLVIGFSLSGETSSILYLLKNAHKKGAMTVLFTSTDNGSFDEFVDEIILLASIRNLSSGNIVSPQFPILVMVDIIYNEYVIKNQKLKIDLHRQSLQALNEQ